LMNIKLNKREIKVIRDRYSFDLSAPKTLGDLGKELGVTRERVRQIEKKALRKLRNSSFHILTDFKND